MKLHHLALFAGATALVSSFAQAGFTGITTVSKPNEFGLLVCNVFATFDRPGQDRFLTAAGTPDSPMDISVIGGTFYQNGLGGDKAPSAALIAVFPSLAFDSFVTIGAKKIGAPGGQTPPPLTLTPGWPGFQASFLGGDNLAWTNTPADPNTDPFNPNFVNGNGQLLIGQFSTSNGTAISGMFRILVISNNVATQLNVSFFHVPGPGGLGLLGLCILGSRRRLRSGSINGPGARGSNRIEPATPRP